MSTRSRKQSAQTKRNQKRNRKEQKRKKRKPRDAKDATGSVMGRKHLQQIRTLIPRAWASENEYDVAVFDETVFTHLDSDVQQVVATVREAFDLLALGKTEEANLAVSVISRKSPMSDWRMLVRGMKYWYANDLPAAEKSWSRLDASRRPARIAQSLTLAHRDDLATLTAQDNHLSPGTLVTVDSAIIFGAKVVRRTRIARSAIKVAEAGVALNTGVEPGFPDLTLTPEMIAWLKEFAANFRSGEPELVRALELTALERAAKQNYIDIFETAVQQIRGPVHDPYNNLCAYFYTLEPNGSSRKNTGYLKKYLDSDLPSNKALSESLRSAMRSVVLLYSAARELRSVRAMYPVFKGEKTTDEVVNSRISTAFKAAIQAYPAHRAAHLEYTKWLEDEIESYAGDKSDVDQHTRELTAAMQCWAESITTDTKPRLFLTEALLDSEQPEQAEPHVEWLLNAQPGDLHVQALPWKLQLLKAMKLSRRIANLSEVPAVLENVKALWPDWLSTRWQPYFKAAWMLRSGDLAGYEKHRQMICAESGITRDSLVDACMMLGAAQKMKVVSADLKPLRAPVEHAVKNVEALTNEDLIAAGSFFWNMCKAKVFYPALRMHGSKFGRELLQRVGRNAAFVANSEESTEFLDSVLWMSEHRFWENRYDMRIIHTLYDLVGDNVFVTAAVLNTLKKANVFRPNEYIQEGVDFLRKSIRTEPEPFYRQWFADVIEEFETKVSDSQRSTFPEEMYRAMDEDEVCECPECTARRARQNQNANRQHQQRQKEPEPPETRQGELF